MTREEAINYLYSSGFSKEQINEIVKAFEPTTNLVDFDRINKLADFGIRITGQKSDYLIGVCNGIEGLRATLTHTTPNLLETPTKNDSTDLISREDALMCLTGEFEDRQYEPSELVSIFSKRIKHLPSVTPIRPKGHWICDGKGRSFADYHCSECGLKLALCGQDIKQRQDSGYSLFCGGCGADMREEKD